MTWSGQQSADIFWGLFPSYSPLVTGLVVAVVKSLYITFLIHKEQFTIGIKVHTSRITVELDSWGTLDGCMDCSLVKSHFFRVLHHKADS